MRSDPPPAAVLLADATTHSAPVMLADASTHLFASDQGSSLARPWLLASASMTRG